MAIGGIAGSIKDKADILGTYSDVFVKSENKGKQIFYSSTLTYGWKIDG